MFLAAVGPHMTEVAGEVADGLLAHPFLTERYLREVTLPALARGRARAGRDGAAFEIGLSAFVALDDADVEAVRRQISFYGSTPAYRPVLELHGWGDLQTELNTLSKQGRWDDMVGLVDDEVLHAMCVVGTAAGGRRRARATLRGRRPPGPLQPARRGAAPRPLRRPRRRHASVDPLIIPVTPSRAGGRGPWCRPPAPPRRRAATAATTPPRRPRPRRPGRRGRSSGGW